MKIKEVIYCMESYLPESSEHCEKCRYYGINIGKEGERYCMSSEAHRMAIRALEQEPKWIPVSERLPESNGRYIVAEKGGRVCIYIFRKEGNSEEYWKRCVVAWMPFLLPEPWKGE